MKVYTVSYNAGTGGTWLTWFINQHEGFQNYDVQFKPETREYCTYDNLMWYYDANSWVDTVAKHTWNDKSKVVYKLFPNHNLYSIDRAFIHLKYSNTIGIIVPYVNEELKQEFVKRNTYAFGYNVEQSVNNLDYSRVGCTSSDPERNYYSKFMNLYSVTPVDMGKLLNCNSNEYHQLLKTIHCDELPEWKQLCAEYKRNCFLM